MMNEYIPLIFTIWGFLCACSWQFDMRSGDRFWKTKIPHNSKLRKIYPFKEDETNPLLYVKFIPFLFALIILVAVFIVYIIYWIKPTILNEFLCSPVCGFISLGYAVITSIYLFVLQI